MANKPHFELNVGVPMRDGVRLAANLFFPEGDGPFPVLLNRTPYGKDGVLRYKRAQVYVKAGYAVVLIARAAVTIAAAGSSSGVLGRQR